MVDRNPPQRCARAVPEQGRLSPVVLRAKTIDDPLFGPTTVREDGRVVHQMLVLQAKAPSQSKSKDDIFTVASVVAGPQAFRPMNEGGCPLIKT